MKLIKQLTGIIFGLSLIANPVLAATELEIRDQSVLNEEISDGKVRVVVNYERKENQFETALDYKIFYEDTLYVDTSQQSASYSSVKLDDIDNDGNHEVIVQIYTGGAHCCSLYTIYTWQGDGFATDETGYLDGAGGKFEDLDGDGIQEFQTLDNAFFYAFDSYAGSFPPSLILSLKDGKFVDTTKLYPQELKSHAWQMFQTLRNAQEQGYGGNGILAGYVAQKILLGEFEEGWEFMLANYDSRYNWGLDIYNDKGDVIGKHPDFPTALRAFLIESGYLLADGTPNPNPNRGN